MSVGHQHGEFSAGRGAEHPGHGPSVRLVWLGTVAYYLLALVCIYLSRQPSEISTMWLPDAFASIYLRLLPRPLRRWQLTLIAVALPLANLSYGDPLRSALSYAPANLLQIALGAWALGRLVAPGRAVGDPVQLLRALTLGGVLPALAGASVATLTVPLLAGKAVGASPGALWLSWLVSSVFGVMTLLPLGLWVLARGIQLGALGRGRVYAALLVVLTVAVVALRWAPAPYAYVGTALSLAAVYGGFVVSALAALLVSVVLNACFALGLFPAVEAASPHTVLLVTPMLVSVVPAVLVGAIREGLDQQLRQVRRGRELQRSMLEAAPSLLCLVDDRGRILHVNAAGARLVGAENEEAVLSRNIAELVTPTPHVAEHRAALVRLDGRRLDVELQREPAPLPDGGHGAVYAVRDITADLEAQRAREAATRSEAESRAKGEFLSRMSHELRTPLNAILGYTQLLETHLGEVTPELQRSWLANISKAGWHLLATIDDVLALSRVEAGASELTRQKVDVASLVHDACVMVQGDAERRSVRVHVDSEGVAAAVLADPLRLRQVLINLLSNAIKYNRDGGQVHVRWEERGGAWLLTVSDEGAGISTEQQAHVFEPYNRLDQTESGVAGTGIGLTISKKLVEAMQGSIGFHSQPGEGTSFWVRLPSEPPAAARH